MTSVVKPRKQPIVMFGLGQRCCDWRRVAGPYYCGCYDPIVDEDLIDAIDMAGNQRLYLVGVPSLQETTEFDGDDEIPLSSLGLPFEKVDWRRTFSAVHFSREYLFGNETPHRLIATEKNDGYKNFVFRGGVPNIDKKVVYGEFLTSATANAEYWNLSDVPSGLDDFISDDTTPIPTTLNVDFYARYGDKNDPKKIVIKNNTFFSGGRITGSKCFLLGARLPRTSKKIVDDEIGTGSFFNERGVEGDLSRPTVSFFQWSATDSDSLSRLQWQSTYCCDGYASFDVRFSPFVSFGTLVSYYEATSENDLGHTDGEGAWEEQVFPSGNVSTYSPTFVGKTCGSNFFIRPPDYLARICYLALSANVATELTDTGWGNVYNADFTLKNEEDFRQNLENVFLKIPEIIAGKTSSYSASMYYVERVLDGEQLSSIERDAIAEEVLARRGEER